LQVRPLYSGETENPIRLLRGIALHFGAAACFALMLALTHDVLPVVALWVLAPTPFVMFLAALERRNPVVEIPLQSAKEFALGFGYMFFDAIVLTLPVFGASWWLGMRLHSDGVLFGGAWAVVSVLVLGDLFGYWLHRSLHTLRSNRKPLFPFGFRMHTLHHTTTHTQLIGNCTLGSSTPTHPAEIPLIHGLTYGLAGGLVGADISMSLAAMIMASMLTIPSHINLLIDIGPLDHIFCSSDHHRWHHGEQTLSKNFGLVFSFWDKMFGTHYQPHTFKGIMGVPGVEAPESTWDQFIVVLPRYWKRLGTGL
jgi:sterol desaturase/sphingolipid hydroxylase (fatty acid hydroxylase superfamily)